LEHTREPNPSNEEAEYSFLFLYVGGYEISAQPKNWTVWVRFTFSVSHLHFDVFRITDLTSGYTTAAIALRVFSTHKPPHHHEVEHDQEYNVML